MRGGLACFSVFYTIRTRYQHRTSHAHTRVLRCALLSLRSVTTQLGRCLARKTQCEPESLLAEAFQPGDLSYLPFVVSLVPVVNMSANVIGVYFALIFLLFLAPPSYAGKWMPVSNDEVVPDVEDYVLDYYGGSLDDGDTPAPPPPRTGAIIRILQPWVCMSTPNCSSVVICLQLRQ